MVCPFCQLEETSVVDSRKNSEGTSIRRRRNCSACNLRFTTYEKASIGIIVKKRNGNREEFNLEKLYQGVQNAFGGQELSEKKLKALVEAIHNEIKEQGNKVQSEFIGETVLKHLKDINEVAYVRFASVYKEFSDASDFEKEVAEFN
ncbi:transcriptional regulator NrdR [Acidimicrobiia bacterium]|jgi:transcriptional repressor NrdR|nr:transcriptional regulator NrdR [Acidimicrobiia bacterium]MDA8652679.1 transcriptional regulator NrdR [Candidatus Actinomarina sp.]MDA7594559.1 transcriptional regulator NrdR [Acidimicrobiia bacterium]MDA8667741.1 transcriptional regulator NrdR [Candidatus Actinomarina sp.]MDA8719214.1 transcriptional regulator NrdR [Candidatus Actinomarina sp.]|tara:strand:- start:644 stop:1084 length:441 start_codon:yes stop_codon:yes gene_type:complete